MASLCNVSIKWGKEKLTLEVDPSASVAQLKNQILKLTGVPIERQKLSCPKAWKGNLSDETDLSKCSLKVYISMVSCKKISLNYKHIN